MCHCWTGEMHFLLQHKTFNEIINIYSNKFNSVISHFKELNELSTLKLLRGEDRTHTHINKSFLAPLLGIFRSSRVPCS